MPQKTLEDRRKEKKALIGEDNDGHNELDHLKAL
jgi:hypothetical protein